MQTFLFGSIFLEPSIPHPLTISLALGESNPRFLHSFILIPEAGGWGLGTRKGRTFMFSTRVSVCIDLCILQGLLPSLSAHFLFRRGRGLIRIFSLVLWQNLDCFVAHLCPSRWALGRQWVLLLFAGRLGGYYNPRARGGRDPGDHCGTNLRNSHLLLSGATRPRQVGPQKPTYVTSQGNA